MLVLRFDDFDEKQKARIKRLATIFVIVLAANFVSNIFVASPNEAVVCQESTVKETVVQLGLPQEMENQLESWARSEPVGSTLNFGVCSLATKTEDRKWQMTIC